jgi:hypothetical protein
VSKKHIDLEQLLAVDFKKDIYLLLLHKLMHKSIDISTDFWQIHKIRRNAEKDRNNVGDFCEKNVMMLLMVLNVKCCGESKNRPLNALMSFLFGII